MSNEVQIDLDAANPVMVDTEPVQVQEAEVVFVPFEDRELRVNQTSMFLKKGVPVKLTRDQARIMLEAKAGYTKD